MATTTDSPLKYSWVKSHDVLVIGYGGYKIDTALWVEIQAMQCVTLLKSQNHSLFKNRKLIEKVRKHSLDTCI